MTRWRRATLLGLALSSALAIAGFVLWSWPLAQNLSTYTLVRSGHDPSSLTGSPEWDLLLANDQTLSLWGAVENARTFARADLRGLMSQGQCYPMPKASALGEHMIELGLLASPWWLASGDPVKSFNLALACTLLIAATGMFLFLHRHTRSVVASVAGAIAFALATPRLVDLPYHPAVVGTHWLPWVLWSFDRLLEGSSGGLAVFALTLLLSSLVGSYPLMAVAIVGAAYAATRLISSARRDGFPLWELIWSSAAALPAVGIAAAIVLTYSGLQSEWVLAASDQAKFLVGVSDYLPGGAMPLGLFALSGLVALVVLRRGAGGAAVPALAAAAVVAFVVTTRFALPGGAAWSLYELLAQHFTLFDSVRGPGKTALAVCFCVQALAAVGWARCIARVPAPVGALIAAMLVAVVAIEVQPPAWMHGILGSGAPMQLREIAPPVERSETLLGILGDTRDRRAVLDLPVGRMVKAPAALLDAAYHGHPTSACYNSLIPPTTRSVDAMAAAVHTERGVAELAAAGFGYVIERPASAHGPLSADSLPPPARLLSFEPGVAIWGLPHPGIIHQDIGRLALKAVRGATRAQSRSADPPHEIDIEVSNRGAEMWVAPRPLAPLRAEVTLSATGSAYVFHSDAARAVLPPALSPGATTTIQLVMGAAPPPGRYRAAISSDRATIEVSELVWLPSEPPGPAGSPSR